MKNIFSFLLAATALSSVWGVDIISNVTITQPEGVRAVTVNYDLSREAIVTVDFLTNGVSVGGQVMRRLGGYVNRKVAAATGLYIVWHPELEMPNVSLAAESLEAKVTAWALDCPPDWMVADLTFKSNLLFYANYDQIPDGGLSNRLYKSDRLLMRKIPAANVRWVMGTPTGISGEQARSKPHYVTLTKDYYISVYPVTQAQFAYAYSGWGFQFPNHPYNPAEKVAYADLRGNSTSWNWPTAGHEVNPNGIIGKFRALTGLTLDLPTDAQWEYACRAGVKEHFNFGYNTAPNYSYWGYCSSSDGKKSATCEVGQYLPNNWGLYEMHGNVFEWCLDWCKPELTEEETDPTGPDVNPSTGRIVRGGGYSSSNQQFYTSEHRNYYSETTQSGAIGFRLACPASIP